MKKAAIGKRYRVISDNINFFNPGDIVVSLQNGSVPYCVLEDVFIKKDKNLRPSKYKISEVSPLMVEELEEIEEKMTREE